MTNQRAIILLSQMYLPAFDEEEKEAITKAIEALTEQEPRVMTIIDREKVINGLEEFKTDLRPFAGNHADWDKFDNGFILLNQLNQQAENWKSLRSTIEEMRDNGGTGTQHGVCRFLANLMDVLEKKGATPWKPMT